jgi:predicted rRNA methylase YqxC with S4 and FtsJ domains
MAVCQRIELLVGRQGWRLRGTIPSPIPGGDGNAEFLLYAEH